MVTSPSALRLLLPFVVASATACGASTELDTRPLPRSSPGSTPSAAPNPAASPTPNPTPPKPDGNGEGSSDPGIGQDNELGACKPGPLPSELDTCPFLADGRCYPDANSACNCICARDRDTTCTEGLFPNPQGSVEVNCYVL